MRLERQKSNCPAGMPLTATLHADWASCIAPSRLPITVTNKAPATPAIAGGKARTLAAAARLYATPYDKATVMAKKVGMARFTAISGAMPVMCMSAETKNWSPIVVVEIAAGEPRIIRRHMDGSQYGVQVRHVHRLLAAPVRMPKVGVRHSDSYERQERYQEQRLGDCYGLPTSSNEIGERGAVERQQNGIYDGER